MVEPTTALSVRPTLSDVDIEQVIGSLLTRFAPEEAVIAERMLRELNGTIPDKQLVEEIGLAIAVYRRQRDRS
jgi:hypothetical protein